MAQRTFFDSTYRFTEPVRYFKANDPYYYDVDNIPIKQLEENTLFLKDQIEGILGASGTTNLIEIGRENFTELKPYVDGTNNKVKVKAGRFSARINDAYSIQPLQIITQILGYNFPERNEWRTETNIGDTVNLILEKFKSTLSADAQNMNGLIERCFTFPMKSVDEVSQYMNVTSPTINLTDPIREPAYPNVTGKIWYNGVNANFQTRMLGQYWDENPSFGFAAMGTTEVDFVKRWRGVTRTAIVNVENELEIEVPPFDSNDFYYIDANGQRILMTANHRIDLVFIYSKPIDTPQVTISRFTGDTPATLTEPTLGIVKGAGLGVSFRAGQGQAQEDDDINLTNVDGIPLILPHIADENSENTGIAGIRGSFPSPDDLMNLSPLLVESVTTAHFALIGQSILPVAYIVVRSGASTNENGVQVLDIEDLIDIRPFFRTTELSYNERAGIAAATPQLSIANPVATEGYVEKTLKELFNDYTSKINQLRSVTITNPTSPKLVGCGYVKGGFNFGVEGTLADLISQRYNLTGTERLKQELITRYGYPANIPDYPDWDISEWCSRGTFTSKGAYPNDYINFHTFGSRASTSESLPFAAFSNAALSSRIQALGTDKTVPVTGASLQQGHSCIYFVKKRVQIDRTNIQWASDYHVDAQLWNCIPLSCRSFKDGNNRMAAGAASIWIDKRPSEFTIYVSWVGSDQFNAGTQIGSTEPGNNSVHPHQARDIGSQFAGFSVINNDFVGGSYIHEITDGESAAGVAIYPTVSFQVYGIPNGYSGNGTNLNGLAPILPLS